VFHRANMKMDEFDWLMFFLNQFFCLPFCLKKVYLNIKLNLIYFNKFLYSNLNENIRGTTQ